MIEPVHKVLKPFKSAMIVLEDKNYVTVSFIPTVIKAMYTKLRDASNAPVTPGPATSVKNLATRLLKYFRLRWLGDEESQFYGKVKCGRGRRRRQCGIR